MLNILKDILKGETMSSGFLKTIILAAGCGTRMKSAKPKVLHKILGKSMLEHVINSAKGAGTQEVCVVVGHKAEEVKKSIEEDDITFVLQKEQLGTGHAVMQAEEFIGNEGIVLVLCGDTPLITKETLSRLIDFHKNNKNSVTVLSTIVDNPKGYGRIIRNENGTFIKSVEDKDANSDEARVTEINSGMYCFNSKDLKEALNHLNNDNSQGEYYLPDTLKILSDNGKKVNAMVTFDYQEILGVNNRVQLHQATKIIQKRINESLMLQGVTIIDSLNTYISQDVIVGEDTIIYPGCILEQNTEIGNECIIGPNSTIKNSKIGNSTNVENSTILDSTIGNNTKIGPYAYVRPNSNIGNNIKIGDFVEIKNSTIDDGTKVAHLTYVGDADVGKNVNFGCGTVIVNYDGVSKHRTIIEDNAFIGCNTNLVSPVKVEKNSYTAAGSTITKNVQQNSLAIARSRQSNIENWVTKNRKRV